MRVIPKVVSKIEAEFFYFCLKGRNLEYQKKILEKTKRLSDTQYLKHRSLNAKADLKNGKVPGLLPKIWKMLWKFFLEGLQAI